MGERYCGVDDVHDGHSFLADDEPSSPRRYCAGRTSAEVQYGRAPGDMHEPKPYTGELDLGDDGSDLLHPFVD